MQDFCRVEKTSNVLWDHVRSCFHDKTPHLKKTFLPLIWSWWKEKHLRSLPTPHRVVRHLRKRQNQPLEDKSEVCRVQRYILLPSEEASAEEESELCMAVEVEEEEEESCCSWGEINTPRWTKSCHPHRWLHTHWVESSSRSESMQRGEPAKLHLGKNFVCERQLDHRELKSDGVLYATSEVSFFKRMPDYVMRNTPWSWNFRPESWRNLKKPKLAVQFGCSLHQLWANTVQYTVITWSV